MLFIKFRIMDILTKRSNVLTLIREDLNIHFFGAYFCGCDRKHACGFGIEPLA